MALSEEHVEARPASCLRPFVARYGGSRRAGFAPREHAATPSRHVTLIVSFEEAIIAGSTPRAWLADELPFFQAYELEALLGSPA